MPESLAPFKRLLRNFRIERNSGCWEWTASTMKSGYGQIKVFGKMVSAHRYSYEIHKGPIQHGLEVMHMCDNKTCINPDHLEVGTHAVNMKQAHERGLINYKKGRTGAHGILSSQAIPVRVRGKVYGSKKEAERQLGLGSGTLSYWIKNNPNVAIEITRGEYLNAK